MALQPDEGWTSEKFIAERVDICAGEVLQDFGLVRDNLTVKTILQQQCDQPVLIIRSWLVGGRIPTNKSTEVIETPDGVWQMFKHIHAPRWFNRRFPVRMKSRSITVVTNNYFVCPHVSVPRGDTRHIMFMATGTPIAARIRDAV